MSERRADETPVSADLQVGRPELPRPIGSRAIVVGTGIEVYGGSRWLRSWWLRLAGAGLLLLLIPVAALAVTHRDPDPLFLRSWWSPIARVPTETLPVGTLGLALLLAAALAAPVSAAARRRYGRRLARGVGVGVVLVVIASVVGAYSAVAAGRADDSAAAIRTVLLREHPATPVSAQARRAIELALGWPAPTPDGISVLHRSTVPVGPWLVQTTEVLNENLSDEGSDVTVETLVDPVDGSIRAAWFYGL